MGSTEINSDDADMEMETPDEKYRDQLVGAWKFVSKAIGSVIRMDELCARIQPRIQLKQY